MRGILCWTLWFVWSWLWSSSHLLLVKVQVDAWSIQPKQNNCPSVKGCVHCFYNLAPTRTGLRAVVNNDGSKDNDDDDDNDNDDVKIFNDKSIIPTASTKSFRSNYLTKIRCTVRSGLVVGTLLFGAFGWFPDVPTTTTTTATTRTMVPYANALTENQALVDSVWKEVNRQYWDRTFNGMGEEGWREKRLQAVREVTNLGMVGPTLEEDQDRVYAVITKMLSSLGDPYTRFLNPSQYESLANYARGSPSFSRGGIGVQLVTEPRTGRVVVMNTVPDSPASKGGIMPGDVIVRIDDEPLGEGITADAVAAKCRGELDSEVTLAVQRVSDNNNNNNNNDDDSNDKVDLITLKRAVIQSSSPVDARIVTSQTTTNDQTNTKLGILSVSSFTQTTEQQVEDALRTIIYPAKVSALVLDLRGNPGGYMPAGVNVAKLFLPPGAKVVTEVSNRGTTSSGSSGASASSSSSVSSSTRATVYFSDAANADTTLPLFILVDQRTASASEILTAALQDNKRAMVVGSVPSTFGKGRIQNVQEVAGGSGSGVAVTKARYLTPGGRDIQGVGIAPDIRSETCETNDSPLTCLKGVL